MTTTRRPSMLLAAGLVALAALPACSPGPVAVSSSPQDPSSPAAPEGVSPLLAQAEDATLHEPPSAASAVVYLCPMHPEVTAPGPGHCPKCGMNLVPKK